MTCPLCESKKIRILEIINKNDLVNLYHKMTDKNFSYLFDDDIKYCKCQNCKLKFFNPMVTGDENFYNALQKFDWYYQDDKEEFKVASKFINKDDKVLEIGSGKGAFAKYLKTKDYIGLDFSKEAKKLAEKQGISIINDTIENFAISNENKFDIVCSFQVLEHVSNPKSFIESSIRVLNGGG